MGKRGGVVESQFDLAKIKPVTKSQEKVFNSSKHLMLHGVAGTGKTFLSIYLAIKALMHEKQNKIVLIRSAVSTREMGFMPGGPQDKASVYETPYVDIFSELFKRGDAYEIFKRKGQFEFKTTSFLRGTTIRDAVVIVDECQNMTYHELDSIITRIGDNCRVIFCGDFRQADLKNNGLKDFLRVIHAMPSFDFIEFGIDDIVRSGLVKEYIIAKENTL